MASASIELKIPLSIVVLAALLVSACSRKFDADAYQLGPTDVAAIISLTPSRTTVDADGFSVVTLTAKIATTSSKRDVQFTASDGTFLVGAQTDNTKKAVVTADAAGLAVTELRTTTTPGAVTVDATLEFDATHRFRQTVNITFAAPSADNVIALSVSPSSIAADGFSRARLTATLKQPDPTKRTVTFKTSTGTLFASSQLTGTAGPLEVVADASGVAVAELQSTQIVDTAFVSATNGGFTRSATVAFTSARPTEIISLSTSASTAPADGATLVQITATVAGGLRNRDVTFTVNDGLFTNGQKTITATADGGNRATVSLKAPTRGVIVEVRATVSGVNDNALITFLPAQPDTILVSPVNIQINKTNTDTINVTLFRAIGVPSAGLGITYSAKDPSGNIIGGFGSISPVTTQDNPPSAQSSAVYNPSGTAYLGPVIITVTVGAVTGTATITIIP